MKTRLTNKHKYPDSEYTHTNTHLHTVSDCGNGVNTHNNGNKTKEETIVEQLTHT